VHDAPVPYRQTDAVKKHSGRRIRRNPQRSPGPRDAETLEPGPYRCRRTPLQDRVGAHRIQREFTEAAAAVVRAEGDQPEGAVLEGGGSAEGRRDLVHELLW
jgi:hypothetical protein